MATIYRIDVDEGTKVSGYLVIDTLSSGRCSGGLRMAPEIPLDSLVQSARTMTLKYAFLGFPSGGAKAGIIADPEMPLADKRKLLHSFGRALKPIIQTRTYMPGADLGVTDDDVRFMLVSNGIRVTPQRLGFQQAGFYAGLSVFAAAARAAEHIGLDLDRASVAIEGFGSVGGSVAESFWAKGSRVVAISTSHGAIYAEGGLDIGELLRLHRQLGNDVVNQFPGAERIDKSKLATLQVDIFCPCAQPYSITRDNALRVTAKIISPGANAPTTVEAEHMLIQNGILLLPDFIANCGGVLAASMKRSGLSDDFVRRFIQQKFGQKVSDMIKAAEKEKKTLKVYAETIAEGKFLRLKEAAEKKSIGSKVFNLALGLYRSGIIPYQLVAPIAPKYFEAKLK